MDFSTFILDMAITTVLTAIKESVKNTKKKAQLKSVMLKIRNKINEAYASDPDFAPESLA